MSGELLLRSEVQGVQVVGATEVTGKDAATISDADARTIATYWQDLHDPDAPLTVLASCGAIEPSTEHLLRRDLEILERATDDLEGDAPVAAQAQMRALLAYVEAKGPRDPVPGWGELPGNAWDATVLLLPARRGAAAPDRNGASGPPQPPPRRRFETLYEEIGGGHAVGELIEVFYRTVMADPALAPYFEGIDVHRIKAHQYAFLSAATGGPEYYVGRSIKRVHTGLRITDEHFDRMVDHLAASLRGRGADEPTVQAVAGKLRPFREDVVTAPRASGA